MSTTDPGRFRDEYLGWWVAEDGTKSAHVRRGGDGQLRVSVWSGLAEEILAGDRPARWHPRDPSAAASTNARRRLDRISVELDEPGLGTTYELMFATENSDPEAFGGLRWRPVDPTAEVTEVRVLPDSGASFYEAVLGPWDDYVEELREADSWVLPFSTYRSATEAESRRLDALRADELRTDEA